MVRFRYSLLSLLWVPLLASAGCGDDEGTGGAGGPGNAGAAAGAGGTPASGGGPGGATTAGAGGAGGSYDECAVGERRCLSHDSRQYCEATADGARLREESCAAGSGCVLGECVVGACSDECTLGESDGARTCELWSMGAQSWVSLDASGSLHDRARAYLQLLRRFGMPFGGVATMHFADPPAYQTLSAVDGIGDSAIWTGTYLASEALRLMATGAADARDHVVAAVDTLHLWFNVSGDAGMLARFAKPSDASVPYAMSDLDCLSDTVHCNIDFEGESYDYDGHISRDQYQGVMLGYSLAYQALTAQDEPTRALIRDDVVELVQALMREREVPIQMVVDGTPIPQFTVTLRFAVLSSREMSNGAIELELDTQNVSESQNYGFQEFIPNLRDLASQIPGLGSLIPTLPRPDSAVMLASFFQVALQVTDGVASHADVRSEIQSYYESHSGDGGNVDDWLAIAKIANPDQQCGDKYYANNIIMEPMANLARLETDPGRLQTIRDEVLGGWLWDKLGTTKNCFFSFIYAANVPGHDPAVVSDAIAQLAGFPLAPRVRRALDLTAEPAYEPHEPDCTNQCNHATAVDVSERAWADFMWQRHPWALVDYDEPSLVAPGVDYLVAYWLARQQGYVAEDAPARCAVWH